MTLARSNPLLSVLIPAYRYPTGVRRILAALGPSVPPGLELVISDDSPDDSVQREVESWRERTGGSCRYRRNCPALGAVSNWNTLLEEASGEYCWLLHHDEYPLGANFLPSLLGLLSGAAAQDVVLLDCILFDPADRRIRRHVAQWLRAHIARKHPGYLLRRNVIGPVSALVVRRRLFPRFDIRLKWLVDVDAYVALFAGKPTLWAGPGLQLGSILGRRDSITAGLGQRVRQIAEEEKAYLREKWPFAEQWLGRAGLDLVSRLEPVFWAAFRFGQLAHARVTPPPVPAGDLARSWAAIPPLP